MIPGSRMFVKSPSKETSSHPHRRLRGLWLKVHVRSLGVISGSGGGEDASASDGASEKSENSDAHGRRAARLK